MRIRDQRLRAAFVAALTGFVGIGTACNGGVVPIDDTGVTGDDTGGGDDTGETGNPDTGTPPIGLEELCAEPSLLGHFSLPQPVDYLALRMSQQWATEPNVDVETWGTPCATAADEAACQAALAEAWPTSSGWGYCGEGCSDSGLAYTRADEVDIADTSAEVAALFGDIDVAAEALFLARTYEYTPVCTSLVQQADGAWVFEGNFLTSDCPWTTEDRRVRIDTGGNAEMLEILEVHEDGACAGRRPDGLHGPDCVPADAVGRHLAHLARLEAAAVVAFERLAVDLEGFDAPADLVRRARRAAKDEVKHAKMLGAVAAARGVTPAPVVVDPHVERPFAEFARENAVEGCVRETFGVADALFRAHNAPTPALRAVFARIARDEARHAELSWDIARWAEGRMTQDERSEIARAMAAAHAELTDELRESGRDEVQAALGAPSAAQAMAMAEALRAA